MADERRHEQCGHRVEQRVAPPHAEQRTQHGGRGQHVAARVLRVGVEDLALEATPCAQLIAHDEHIDDERHRHHADALREHARRPAVDQAIGRGRHHLQEHDDEEQQDADRGHRLVLAVAVRVIPIRRPARDRHADQRHHVRRGVGQGVKAVGEDGDRPGHIAQGDLDDGDREIEEEDAVENARSTASRSGRVVRTRERSGSATSAAAPCR